MLASRVERAKTEAAESNNCFTSDSLRLDVNPHYCAKKLFKAQIILSTIGHTVVVSSSPLGEQIGYIIYGAGEVKNFRAATSMLENIFSHRNLRLHGDSDKGLHQGVQRCIQAEEIER